MITVVGVSHHSAPLSVREALAFHEEMLPSALAHLRAETGVDECLILSTCNRVELYASLGQGTAPDVLVEFLAEARGLEPREIQARVYRLAGDDAVRHAFRVAASLDSMVIGESQILGQLKRAYRIAEEAGTLGPILNALRNRSLAAAKRARTQTGMGRNAVSVSSVAVELAAKIFGDLAGRNVLVVGAGKMTKLAARQLVRSGASPTVLGVRTLEHAEELAETLGARAAPYASLREELARADVVVSGTGAPGLVIRRADVEAALARRQRPLFLIDMAVPRDIDPSLRDRDGVFLYDLDDLKSVAAANVRERRRDAQAAEAVVWEEVQEFLAWQRSRDVAPLVVELRRRAEEIRRDEVERARERLGPMTAEQSAALEAVTTALVNKLLHEPTVRLKEIARAGGTGDLTVFCRLFGLEIPAQPGPPPAAEDRARAMPEAAGLSLSLTHS